MLAGEIMEFKDLIFYEIYPTSFYDSNNDGIGDLNGIKEKLDYVKDLGFNAIWLNPFYPSPFKDGGYDITNFFDVDKRFGTLDDFKSLLKRAHELDIKIIIDLVAGHASNTNEEFLKSASSNRNEYSDLFIWNDSVWSLEPYYRLISGMFDRNGCYLVNFFAHQPAFNYGFNRIEYPWQMSYQDPRTYQAREYLLKIMRFWLNLGVDGFRVDMADSLVKNDDNKDATIEVWKYLFGIIRNEYPNAFFVSEWSNPHQAFEAGFDTDFVLDHWDNFYHRLVRSDDNTRGLSVYNGQDLSYMMNDLIYRLNEAKNYHKYLGLISGNHDTRRIANYLNREKLKSFYLFFFSLPGVPFVLYGDEIEMKTSDIPSKDGGYQRTGTRIPFIWDDTFNHGFSSNKDIYLPFNDEINPKSLQDLKKDEKSLFYFLKDLIKIRKEYDSLKSYNYEIINDNNVIKIIHDDLLMMINFSNVELNLEDEVLLSSHEIKNKLPKYHGAILKR